MRKRVTGLCRNAVMIVAVVLLAACTADSVLSEKAQEESLVLTVHAVKGEEGVTTRGLELSGKTLNAVWTSDDKVAALTDDWSSVVGTLTPSTTGTAATVLKSAMTVAVGSDAHLHLLFPRSTWDYTGQDGSLGTLSASFDYALADVVVQRATTTTIHASDAVFDNQQAVVRFILTDQDGSAINASSLTIHDASGKLVQRVLAGTDQYGDLTVTPKTAANELYTALRGVDNSNLTLTALVGGDTYTYSKTGLTFVNSHYYACTVKMQRSVSEPLTFEAVNDETQIIFQNLSGGTVEFRRDDGEWRTYTSALTLDAGEKVGFRGNNASYFPDSDASHFECTDDCYVYGNVMSLISATDYDHVTELTDDHTFRELFKDNTFIRNHPEKELLLPATTLTANCYRSMFEGCT
ncbi:MAG: hypothetical protein IJQ13_03105, partial [Prevotella sp.]|nr:hypothetical protein [Prevotella sp.]